MFMSIQKLTEEKCLKQTRRKKSKQRCGQSEPAKQTAKTQENRDWETGKKTEAPRLPVKAARKRELKKRGG